MGAPGLHRRSLRLIVPLLCGAGAALAAALKVSDAFDHGFAAWQPIEPANWAIREADGNAYLALIQPGKLRPGVRRPGEYVLLKGHTWRDVTITAKVMSLRPTTLKGRDVVLVFGWQDDTHCYYTHLSNDTNGATHNVIVKVEGETRRPIMAEKKPEPRLSDGWHDVKVVHQADGAIRVYLDDLAQPLMTAQDSEWPQGMVGLGSFDDPAAFDDVTIAGESTPPAG